MGDPVLVAAALDRAVILVLAFDAEADAAVGAIATATCEKLPWIPDVAQPSKFRTATMDQSWPFRPAIGVATSRNFA
jgi:hypothetical protein